MVERDYNLVSRVSELEKRVAELEDKLRRNDEICSKCQSLITNQDGICWKCYINSNK